MSPPGVHGTCQSRHRMSALRSKAVPSPMQKPHALTNQPRTDGDDAPGSVIIVGGGVFGCACAYELARRGLKVTVVERDDFGVHASRNNPGNINPIHCAAPALNTLALMAYTSHRTLH